MILRPDSPPRIIALEGIDGAGKTSCRDLIVKQLRSEGHDIGGAGEFMSPIGSWLSTALRDLSFLEKVLYFAADRASALRDATASGAALVIWDRYVLSAFAYRLAELDRLGRMAEREECFSFIATVNGFFPSPVLTVWLQLSPEIALDRKPGGLEVLRTVHQAYNDLFEALESPWVSVDASGSLVTVAGAVAKIVREELGE
ncbi:MAG: dTMP kinase [Ilumatobacteraceae bacterium]